MMRILLTITGLFLATLVQAEVYRSVDENGNVIYTDKPSENAEKIEVQGIQTIDGGEQSLQEEPAEMLPEEAIEAVAYTLLTITSPANDTSITENDGNVTVSVSLAPGLQEGDKLILMLDGNMAGESSSGQFQLTNIDRGSHTLTAVVQAQDGKALIRSEPVTFTLQRHSVKHKPSTVGKQPKPPAKPPAATPTP